MKHREILIIFVSQISACYTVILAAASQAVSGGDPSNVCVNEVYQCINTFEFV